MDNSGLMIRVTKKSQKFPIILVGSKFWNKCYHWIKSELVETYKYISPHELDLISIVDSSNEVIDIPTELRDYFT